MHIQAAPSSPVCLQQGRGGTERETPSNQLSPPNTGIILASVFILLPWQSLWTFLLTEESKVEWMRKSTVENMHTPAH